MSKEHEMFQELREARKRLMIARVAEQDVRTILSERTCNRLRAELDIDEILCDMETERSSQLRLDPDVVPSGKAEVIPAKQPGIDHPFQWTTEDLDQCLEDACHATSDVTDLANWPKLQETGCDDAQIFDVLRTIWPASAVLCYPPAWGRPGYSVQGGNVPKFWVGARKSDDQSPTLAGLDLILKVRQVLNLPLPALVPKPTAEKTKSWKEAAK